MRVCLYSEVSKLLEGSGISSAFKNHLKALRLIGVEVLTEPDEEFDLFHATTVGPKSFLLMKKLKRRGVKVVTSCHTLAEDFKLSWRFSDRVAPLLASYLEVFYKSADLVIAPSSYAKRLLVERYGLEHDSIRVVSNGVDTEGFKFSQELREAFREANGLDGFVVLSVGHLFPRKGVETFIELATRYQDLTFCWIGKKYTRLLTDSRVERLLKKAPQNFRHLGVKRGLELVSAYCGCDLFLFPSLCELQGLVVLEAAACERPMLLRDLEVYDWLEDGKDCLKARHQQDFCYKLSGLLDDPQLRERLGKSARCKVEREHSLRVVGKELLAAYEELIAA